MISEDKTSNYYYHYSKFFNGSDREFDAMSQYYMDKLSKLGVISGSSKVLEIGCGWGFCLGGLNRMGVSGSEGIDIDPMACRIAVGRGLNATLVDVDEISSFMGSREATYDVVLAFDVLEHVPLQVRDGMLNDVFKVLKPGGIFICQVPNANSVIASYMRYVDYTHTATFTHISLDVVLHNAGFEGITVQDAESMAKRPPMFPLAGLKAWAIKRMVRMALRAIYVAELGSYPQVWSMPLDKNIIAVAKKKS